jgi:hypothetical protein
MRIIMTMIIATRMIMTARMIMIMMVMVIMTMTLIIITMSLSACNLSYLACQLDRPLFPWAPGYGKKIVDYRTAIPGIWGLKIETESSAPKLSIQSVPPGYEHLNIGRIKLHSSMTFI